MLHPGMAAVECGGSESVGCVLLEQGPNLSHSLQMTSEQKTRSRLKQQKPKQFASHLRELPELIFVCVRQQRQQRHLGLLDHVRGLAVTHLQRVVRMTSCVDTHVILVRVKCYKTPQLCTRTMAVSKRVTSAASDGAALEAASNMG